MKKINNEMGMYILFTTVMILSWLIAFFLYYSLLNQPMDYHDMPVFPVLSACFTGGWIVFTIIVLPAFSSHKLFEE